MALKDGSQVLVSDELRSWPVRANSALQPPCGGQGGSN